MRTVTIQQQVVRPVAVVNRKRTSDQEDRRSGVDGLLAIQMLDHVAFLERKLVGLEEVAKLLKQDNVLLKKQIVDLTLALETTWPVRADKVSQALDTFFLKFRALHQPLVIDREKAGNLRKSEDGLNSDDWGKLRAKVGDKALGEAHETLTALSWYFMGLKRPFAEIKQLQPSFKDSLKAALTKEASQLVNPVVPLSAKVTSEVVIRNAEDIPMPRSRVIDEYSSAFQLFAQQKIQSIEALQTSNLKMKEENSQLELVKEKIHPEKINTIFLDILNKELVPFSTSKFHSGVAFVIQKLEEYPPRLKQLCAHPPVGIEALGLERRMSQLCTGVALSEKICPVLREIDALLYEIEKGCPIEELST